MSETNDRGRQEVLGKKIIQNCRNELYLDFPYLDGAFASLEYEVETVSPRLGQTGKRFTLTRYFY